MERDIEEDTGTTADGRGESGVRTTTRSQPVTAKAVVTSSADPTWYKDAIIYQLHVKAYMDANDDGIGDFRGLISKLDYIESLGVTALWLLPFYPSPLRDDGYDISDYRNIHPSYGTMADFRAFVREAHRRGLRVISELVVNHTSDQHPWFQRARRAPKGSKYRDYYVWSDTDQKYAGTRIIFLDTEKSNWTWDPVAEQYYWHRFYSHQPDLNFDNPAVVTSILNCMNFWLDLGIDGLRLDAVPYLCEREGTNNENLPETHAILKRLRAEVDRRYQGRMLLAEANQWPEDVLPYFGTGDECHMAFNFPLMPRIYMAVAQQDRHPITDIVRQTPDLPNNCQWAIFLRNHDELTLEMVTDQERDYLWSYYANDARMRINLGIRRRLAPLMENNRPKIDLLNSILLSMPGTPVLYYGDEIGMGDNVYLGDRDGVRTPMQWSLDRNGGFSRADPARLFLPPIQDPVFGFQAVNVEAQSRSTSSLLNTTRKLIAVRSTFKAFGRGTMEFLYPDNRKVMAYLRRYEDEIILCVVNLARTAQPVELDLSQFRGLVPVELIGRTQFPAVTERAYMLTLQGYNFFWFSLIDPQRIEGAGVAKEEAAQPDFVTLVMPRGWSDLAGGRDSVELEHDVLRSFLPKQRWFGSKDRSVAEVRIVGAALLPATGPGSGQGAPDSFPDGHFLAVVAVGFETGAPERYSLPLGLLWAPARTEARAAYLPQTLAHTRRGRDEGALLDAAGLPDLTLAMLAAIREERSLPFGTGVGDDRRGDASIRFAKTGAFDRTPVPENPQVRRLGAEQSNSSVLIEDYAVFKLYRKLESGVHPELEMGRYLADKAGFSGTPALLGTAELVEAEGGRSAFATLSAFVRNQGDAWGYTLEYLKRAYEDSLGAGAMPTADSASTDEHDPHAFFLTLASQLGRRTAELHRALCPAEEDDLAFRPEPVTEGDIQDWAEAIRQSVETVFAALEQRPKADAASGVVGRLLGRRHEVLARIESASRLKLEAMKTRLHGDYHLGQVLVVQNDFSIIDFEGEPRRPMALRRHKYTALKDVAGMVRSFDYAAAAAARNAADLPAIALEGVERFYADWRRRTVAAFLAGYRETIAGSPVWPRPATPGSEAAGEAGSDVAATALLDLLILDKAFYEIGYELANRPSWLTIPVEGVLRLLDGETRGKDVERS